MDNDNKHCPIVCYTIPPNTINNLVRLLWTLGITFTLHLLPFEHGGIFKIKPSLPVSSVVSPKTLHKILHTYPSKEMLAQLSYSLNG